MEETIKTKRRLRDAIKPDCFVTDAQVKKYGYDKGYLYPVYRSRARLFYDFGLTVYKLGKENSKTEIRNEKGFGDAGIYCGISKQMWGKFIRSPLGFLYLDAVLLTARCVQTVAEDYAQATGKSVDPLFEERIKTEISGIESYLKNSGRRLDAIDIEQKSILFSLALEYGTELSWAFTEFGERRENVFLYMLTEEIMLRFRNRRQFGEVQNVKVEKEKAGTRDPEGV